MHTVPPPVHGGGTRDPRTLARRWIGTGALAERCFRNWKGAQPCADGLFVAALVYLPVNAVLFGTQGGFNSDEGGFPC